MIVDYDRKRLTHKKVNLTRSEEDFYIPTF